MTSSSNVNKTEFIFLTYLSTVALYDSNMTVHSKSPNAATEIADTMRANELYVGVSYPVLTWGQMIRCSVLQVVSSM